MKTIQTKNYQIILYDRQDLASILGVSQRTIQNMHLSNRLPHQRIANRYYTSETDLMRFIQAKSK